MKTVLFVCTANIARSPIAEAIFNNIIQRMGFDGEFQAKSAGAWARDGIPAPEDGQKVMEVRGLDTSHHVSRFLTESILEQADLVLTMEAGHKEALQIEFPSHSAKIFMLSEMVDAEFDIDDPFMMGLERYETTAQELEKILEDGKEKIFKILKGAGS
jgi:protein-tyrosine phosphatase